ncbi:MAG: hypothetical protein ACT4P6_22580 [Gemmatimonadaceae bacterium]
MSLRRLRTPRIRPAVAWLGAIGLTAVLGLAAGTLLRADEAPLNALDQADLVITRALGAPTGVLAVVNPVNCALTAQDAAALNAIASLPGVRVTVLLLAVPARDSVFQEIRRDFGFSTAVVVAAAATVNPRRLPDMFRMPFIAVLSRGQLRHAAWGQSLKGLHAWLPSLVGIPADARQHLTPSAS